MVTKYFLKLVIALRALIIFYIHLQKTEAWKINIIHTNDMHSRFDEISSKGIECTPLEKLQKKCYGGFPRMATLIRQAKNNTNIPTLYFDAGDVFQGTPWFTVYNWTIASRFLNILKPDAFSLGNHEFDNGPGGLIPFINAAEFPILCANLNLTNEPIMAAANIKKSIIINVGNHRIGVIGYLTPETQRISDTGRVEFSDEIESIKQEVEKLVAEGVNILIALGHSGVEMDKKIAAEIDHLDLVIGGHTHTFLYSGSAPDTEIAENLYPTVVEQKNGRKVYVVQAFTMTKYLGNLSITFDRFGEIIEIFGNPILVDDKVEKASDVAEILEELRPAIANLTQRALGYSEVPLYHDWRVCRMEECNFGNLVTDSMVEYNKMEFKGQKGWTDAAAAIIGSGSIKLTINKTCDQPIIFGDLMTALPHPHVLLKVEVSGKILHQMLEHSVDTIYPNKSNEDPSGQFLHFSGIKVTYDLNRPINSRVIKSEILCTDCDTPKFENIDENKLYKILTSDFIHGGGDNFHMLKNCRFELTGTTVRESVEKYFQIHKIVNPKVDGRIKFVEH